MSISPIHHVLEIARMVRDGVKAHGSPSTLQTIETVKGITPENTEFYPFLSEVQRQLTAAAYVIENDDRMEAEGRDGLLQQIRQLKLVFGPSGLPNTTGSYVSNPDILVSQFAIIVGFYGPSTSPYLGAKPELAEIAAEVDALAGLVAASDQSEEIKSVLQDQIKAMKFFILNVDMLGFDAAYSAYFDLVVRLRRVEKTSASAADFVGQIWPSIERWAGRIAIIEGLAANSEKLIETAGQLQKLIT
jgi:hypothetical protein